MPLYNKAPYVKKAMESVLTQTYNDWELIVIDDGSTDDSYALAENVLLEWGCDNVKLIKQSNTGVGATRNFGVQLSKNEFLCFLDADDWWENNFLEEMDTFLSEFPDSSLFATDYFYVKNKKKRTYYKADTGYINYCKVYSESGRMPVWTGATCIKRCVFDEFGGFPINIKLGEDFCLWIRVALKYKVAFLNKSLSNYNQDVDVSKRLTRHLHKPEHHMLFNMSELEHYEETNNDYKNLIDKLRISGLLDYYIDDRYNNKAKLELKKVDWNRISKSWRKIYQQPICYLKIKNRIMKYGSVIKQLLLNFLIRI